LALFNAQSKKSSLKDNRNPFIQPGQYTDEELPIAELIQRRRLQMLIHSKLYYDMDTNLITDRQFDEWGRELVQLQRDNPDIAKRICFAEAFKDWDASTGAFLPLQDPWVIRKAQQLLNIAGQKGVINNIEYKKVQQNAGVKSSKKPERKKATKQRGNALF
jgi:hypothetical protein